MSVPLSNERHQAISQMSEVGEVTALEPLALHDTRACFIRGGKGQAERNRQTGHVHLLQELEGLSLQENNENLAFSPESFFCGAVLRKM
jgi:hypothetical protein